MSNKAVFYTVYQTTNIVNGKTYIGKHQTTILDDGYLGSGKLLRKAIDKYGVENFNKEILHVFDNEAEMNAKEAELVTKEFVLQESNYNLCVGGHGGWSYVNRELPNGMLGKTQSQKQRKIASQNRIKANQTPGFKGIPCDWSGRTHKAETIEKISKSRRGKGTKEANSQFGKRWITNGSKNKKIEKTDSIPNGWYAGRTLR